MIDEDASTSKSLSPAGRRRREAILAAAVSEARRRQKRRRAIRASATGVVAACMITAVVMVTFRNRPPAMPDIARTSPSPPTIVSATQPDRVPAVFVVRPRPAEVTIAQIATDHTLVDRLAAPRIAQHEVERVDDTALQQALGSAGLSGGVVVHKGRPELWWQPTALRDLKSGGKRSGI